MTNSIKISSLGKTYSTRVVALADINLGIRSGSFNALQGKSGSGKSTLLYALSGLLTPNSGSISILGTSFSELSESEKSNFRAQHIGMIFQNFHLLPYLTIRENILACSLTHKKVESASSKLEKQLDHFALAHRADHKPSQLSAGECQRVAILRAIFSQPKILLADEPTGNLDPENSTIVLEHLKSYASAGNTVIMATHSTSAADCTDRVIELANGKLISC
jgi:putative ABC transport system ATP-binding protein